ncbi:MAG TPA: DNA translocase FtsK [Patescibacteria group bacterium]|nr:DNA translocase FtsK [Patescibacteria group bacterium]
MAGKRAITKGIVLLLSSIFIGVALVSFDPRDWGSFWKVRNLCGPAGAVLAGSLRSVFGWILSWYFPFLLGYWGIQSFRGASMKAGGRRLINLFLLVWIIAALAALGDAEQAGGMVGVRTARFLGLVLGRIGSILVLAGILIVIALLLFFGSVKCIVESFRKLSSKLGTYADRARAGLAGWSRRRTRRRRPREEEIEQPVVREEAYSVQVDAGPVKISVPEPRTPAPKRASPPKPRAFVPHSGAEKAPLPDIVILDDYPDSTAPYRREDLIARSEVIESKLKDYGLEGKVKEVRPGPVVTTFEYVPAPGVRVSQIASRSDDISLALAARAIRIQAPIPGKGAVGIEVPNPEMRIVPLREMMEQYPSGDDGLNIALGKTVTGEPYFADLADMPHLLIAGATGSGKSVCINSIICSLLFHHTPATCRFILVDPKRLELNTYNGIPHLLHPVITEARDSLKVLQWLTIEMEQRYKLLASVGVKNIQGFNRKVGKGTVTSPETGEKLATLPYYVTVIDELADIMVTMGNEIYPPITRLSQMARAVGIHLVFATQRPSVDVVTGLIKANFPSRIAFQVTSKTDSRTILDVNGAEKLLGNGDMLYLPKNLPAPIRIQGAFISEAETVRVAEYWKDFQDDGIAEIDFFEERADAAGEDAEIDDDLFNKAKELVIMHQQGSISLVQRRLRVGYARAARLIDMLEQSGVVGPFEGSKARQVLVSREDYERSRYG